MSYVIDDRQVTCTPTLHPPHGPNRYDVGISSLGLLVPGAAVRSGDGHRRVQRRSIRHGHVRNDGGGGVEAGDGKTREPDRRNVHHLGRRRESSAVHNLRPGGVDRTIRDHDARGGEERPVRLGGRGGCEGDDAAVERSRGGEYARYTRGRGGEWHARINHGRGGKHARIKRGRGDVCGPVGSNPGRIHRHDARGEVEVPRGRVIGEEDA